MSKSNKRFHTRSDIARAQEKAGWRDLDPQRVLDVGNEATSWKVADAGNVARIARALERIAAYMARQTQVMESREQREKQAELARQQRERQTQG